MSPRFRLTGPLSVFWLGLLWVWSGAPWFFAMLGALMAGLPLAGAAMFVHLLGAIGIGIGLSANERWGWAAAFCVSSLYLAGGGLLAVGAAWTLVMLPPGTLSWHPVFLGLTREQTARAVLYGAAVGLLGLGNLWLLWRHQEHYHVPDRRPFTTLVRYGIGPMLPVLAADLFLVYGAWVSSLER